MGPFPRRAAAIMALDVLAVAAAFFIALMLRFVKVELSHFNDNKMVDNIILSAILTFLALIGQYLFPSLHSDLIIIGDIMLLIPGIAITTAVRDTLIGDTISGIIKLADSMVWAGALAAGFMIAIRLTGGLFA
jgi:uncharacterized membrane protein YjjP (DUF1212 family)